jgi:homoserine kinase
VIWAQWPAVVRVPATSANLGPGFDAFGLALAMYDQVEARVTAGGLDVVVRGEGEGSARDGERHLVVRAMRAAFGAMGGQPAGIALRCTNVIPHGRGLGSSAAAVVAGILAARALVADGADRLPDTEVLRLAVELEGHPDNVAACLAGGLTVAWRPGPAGASVADASLADGSVAGGGVAGGGVAGGGVAGLVPGAGVVPGAKGGMTLGAGGPVRLLRLDVLGAITAVACVAPTAMATHEARRALPGSVPHADAAANAARSALLVAALTSDPAVLFDATEDYLHQRYRAAAQPATADLLARLRRAGVAAVVSGAGPSILALGPAGGQPGPAGELPGMAGDRPGPAGGQPGPGRGQPGPGRGQPGPGSGQPGPGRGRPGAAHGQSGLAGGQSHLADVLPGLAAVDSIARETGIAWHVTPLKVDRQGATVHPGGTGAPRPGAAWQGRSTNQAPDPGVHPAGGSTQGRATNPGTHGPQSRECRGLLWC